MKRALPVALAAIALAGCGSNDDGSEKAEPGPPKPPPPADAKLLRSPRLGFTFRYPEDFRARVRRRGGVLAQVAPRRGDALNALKVRRTSNRELPPSRYLAEFQRDFSRSVGQVDRRRERIGRLELGVLEFDETVERRGERAEFTSTSYFFRGAGRTWQLECTREKNRAARMEAACRQALETIEFRRGR